MIQENVLLKDFTTLKVGGPAACFAVVAHAKAQNQSVHIIGGGSNILVPEKGLADICGKTRIERTIERSKKARALDALVVTTDSSTFKK
jgi:UDP-N-acetylenolpyruvoylglucosamine reductase